ncbi:MAG: oligosaccharide repeat unit polymerase [Bacteroidota bacterium]
MNESLFFASGVDIMVLLISSFLLFKFGKISIYHPATTYLVFHIFAFTGRLIALSRGTSVFLGGQTDYFTEIENHEIIRAALLADIGFISMTIAWLWEANRKSPFTTAKPIKLLDENTLKTILYLTIPLGIWGIISQLYIPGIGKVQNDFGAWGESSYIANTQNWLILSYLIIVFKYGFRQSFLVIIGLVLVILAFQGQHRYRILTPCIFMLFLYLHRQKQHWISFRFVLLLIIGVLIFLPMKYVGKLVQQGATTADLIEFSSEYRESLGVGANADFSFLDMYASILTLIDQAGGYFYGSTYFTLLLAPIPRPFWDAKPSLMQWMTDISTPSRNLRELGAIATIYGESYANFGYLGILIIPFLFAKYSARWYFKILNTAPQSANLYLYLYFSAILMQVYRDGLNAIFMFLSVYNMPGFFVYIFSIFKTQKS